MALIGSIAINMAVQTKALAKGLGAASAAVKDFGDRTSRAASLLGGAFAVGGAAAAAGLAKMVKVGSDLNENMSKTEAIFGDASSTVVKAADDMAAAFGVSKNEFLDGSARLGTLFKGAGFARKDAADLSAQFTKLARDASSFYNLDFDSALNKLSSGLSGESQPLKDLGILMNEDMVKARALEMGLVKQGEALSEGAKVQARAALIVKGLADVEGDLARTADGVANSWREMNGRVENLAGTIGKTLQPIAQAVLGELSTAVSALGMWWEDSKASVVAWGQSAVGAVGGVAGGMGWLQKSIGFVADAWQSLKLGFYAAQAFITAGLGSIIGGLSKLGYAIDYAVEKLSGFRSGVGDYLKTFGEDLDRLGGEQWKHFTTELAKPPASAGVDAYFAKARDQIKAVRKEVAGAKVDIASLKPAAGTAAAKAEAPKYASAALAGSREAADTILRSRYGMTAGNRPAEQTAKNTARANELLSRIAGAVGANAGAVAAMGFGAF